MFFWIFMLIMNLITPFIMISFGYYFMNKAPKEINMIFGYRTTMSMKNKDTWEFAHKYIGRLWFKSGLVLLPLSILAMLPVMSESQDVIGTVSIFIIFIQIIPLIATIIPTEKALRNNFDKNEIRIIK